MDVRREGRVLSTERSVVIDVAADGLATALFVTAPECLSDFEFSWVRMLADGRVQWSKDLPGELFL